MTECKGIIFRCFIAISYKRHIRSKTLYNGTTSSWLQEWIFHPINLALQRKKSCPGCPNCKDLREKLKAQELQGIDFSKLKHGRYYGLTVDSRTGLLNLMEVLDESITM